MTYIVTPEAREDDGLKPGDMFVPNLQYSIYDGNDAYVGWIKRDEVCTVLAAEAGKHRKYFVMSSSTMKCGWVSFSSRFVQRL